MSDAHRKDLHTSELPFSIPLQWRIVCWFDVPVFIEAKETLTPDFTKSKSQKVKEHATDAADRIARYVESPLVLPKYISSG